MHTLSLLEGGLSKAKCGAVAKDECELISDQVISPAEKKHTGADNVDKLKYEYCKRIRIGKR